MAVNPIRGLNRFEQRIKECLGFVRRMIQQEPYATRLTASHDSAFQVSAEQYDLLYKQVLAFAEDIKANDIDFVSIPPNPHTLLYERICKKGYIEEWWKSSENTYLSLLEWTQTCIFFVESVETHRETTIVHFNGDVNMAAVFKNISGSTIINNSLVQESFNTLTDKGNTEAADLVLEIGKFINASNDVVASKIYESLLHELKKPEPNKNVLKSSWDGIVAIVPPVANLAAAAAKIFSISV